MDNHQSHTIRLQSVWEPPSLPAGAWRRRFGRPSGLGVGDRVVLVIEQPAAAATLNGVALPVPAADTVRWTYDITALLADRNELVLSPAAAVVGDQPGDADAHGRASLPVRYGAVSLEILTPPAADR